MVNRHKRGKSTSFEQSGGGQPRPKGVPNSVRIGQRGINLIERIVEHDMGHLWTPTHPASDAGTDGFIELCDHTGGATGQILQVQSKATHREFVNETATSFEFVCNERDLARWLEGNAPFILVVSRPPNEAYWIPIKKYFADADTRGKRTVYFDKAVHAFNQRASDALRTLALPKAAGIYTQTPAPREETLFANLVPVSRYAQKLFVAETKFRDAQPLFKELEKHVAHPRGEWFLKDERIFTFHDLHQYPWSEICETGSIVDFPTDDWAQSPDRERIYDFVRVLKDCLKDHLGRRGVRFFRRRKDIPGYYFFKATKDLNARIERWRALRQGAERSVFEAHHSKTAPARIAYYRHLAFIPRFRRFAGQWYLEITPTYHFTRDGVELDGYREERLSGIKRIEKNAAVFSSVLFWSRFVSSSDELFRKGNEFIQFTDLREFSVDFGVNDDEWKNRAEEDERRELEQEGGRELLLEL
jgi:hypothetical protein